MDSVIVDQVLALIAFVLGGLTVGMCVRAYCALKEAEEYIKYKETIVKCPSCKATGQLRLFEIEKVENSKADSGK